MTDVLTSTTTCRNSAEPDGWYATVYIQCYHRAYRNTAQLSSIHLYSPSRMELSKWERCTLCLQYPSSNAFFHSIQFVMSLACNQEQVTSSTLPIKSNELLVLLVIEMFCTLLSMTVNAATWLSGRVLTQWWHCVGCVEIGRLSRSGCGYESAAW